MKDVCDNCFMWTLSGLHAAMNPLGPLSMLRCNGCKIMSYCSKACQVKAWKSHHKAECKIYASHQGDGIPHAFRATLRILGKHLRDQLTGDQFFALLNLKGHKDWLKKIDGGAFWSLVEEECKNLKQWSDTGLGVDVIEGIFSIFLINSMGIHSPGMRDAIGSSLDPFAALMNHSCDPNSSVFFEGPDLRVRSLREIAPNEELTISYIDYNESFSVRQEQLATKYHFTCTCAKCKNGPYRPGDLITGDERTDKSIQDVQSQLRALLQLKHGAQSVEAIEATARRICAEGLPGKPWPCELPPTCDLHIALSELYQEKKNWPKAFAYQVTASFEAGPLIWPSEHDQHRVQNLMKYVRIETQIANLLSAGDPDVMMLQPLKGEIVRIQHAHGKQYAESARKAFGEDSTMAEAAKVWAAAFDMMFADQGGVAEAISSYYATKEGKSEILGSEKKLLDWARAFTSEL